MGRPCSICEHPKRSMIEQKIKSGAPFIDVERWLATTDTPAGRMSLSRHAGHAGLTLGPRLPGPRPASGSFLADVEAVAHADLTAGVLRPTIRDGIAARVALDNRADRIADREIALQMAQALGGHVARPVVIDMTAEEVEDAAFFAELTSGEEPVPVPADRQRSIAIARREAR